jgi:hypothetical protein
MDDNHSLAVVWANFGRYFEPGGKNGYARKAG